MLCGGGGLGEGLDGDLDVGAAEFFDTDTDAGGLFADDAEDVGGVGEGAELEGDFFAHLETARGELDGEEGLVGEILQTGNFGICQFGVGAEVGGGGAVEEVAPDELIGQNLLSFLVGGVDEDVLGDDHALDLLPLLALTVFPQDDLFLGGGEAFVVEQFEFLAGCLFGVGQDAGYQPFFLTSFGRRNLVSLQAYGIASAHHCRLLRIV